METSININGLQEKRIKDLREMEKSLNDFPELRQIKKVMEQKNKQTREKTDAEKNKEFFNKLGVAYYE